MSDPVILLGTQSNGETLPVQVNGFGQLVAEGLDGAKGDPGPKGDPFTYDDFTPEQLADLQGPEGPPGSEGPAGPEGPQGPGGPGGGQGPQGPEGPQGPQGPKGDPGPQSNVAGDFYASGTVRSGTDLMCDKAVVFRTSNNGALKHLPEHNGGLLIFRLVSNESKFYFKNNANNSWVEVATASDVRLKHLKPQEMASKTASSVIDQLEVISFQWNEEELRRANLEVAHNSGTTYPGFNAEQFESILPGTTILNDYLPGPDGVVPSGEYRSIENQGISAVVAALVSEVQNLKLRLSQLENMSD